VGFWLWQIGEEDGGGDCRLLNWDPITPETGGLRCEGVPVEEGAISTALSFDKSPKPWISTSVTPTSIIGPKNLLKKKIPL